MYPFLVIYQKPNGEVIYRIVKFLFLDVGQENNSGWKVISIQQYNSKKKRFEEIVPWYSHRYYNYSLEKRKKEYKKMHKRNKLKNKIKKIITIIKE